MQQDKHSFSPVERLGSDKKGNADLKPVFEEGAIRASGRPPPSIPLSSVLNPPRRLRSAFTASSSDPDDEKRDQQLKQPSSKRKPEETNIASKKEAKTKGDLTQAFTKAEEKKAAQKGKGFAPSSIKPSPCPVDGGTFDQLTESNIRPYLFSLHHTQLNRYD